MSTAPQTNGYDKARTAQVVDDIEGLKAEQRRIKQAAADKIAPEIARLSGQIGAKLKEAKKAWGIPTHILKAHLKVRDLQRKENEVVDALDEEDQEGLIVLRESLGDLADLPLGAVLLAGSAPAEEAAPTEKAKERKERKARQNADIDALGASEAETVASNVTALQSGIKQTSH